MNSLQPVVILPQPGMHEWPSGALAALSLTLPPGGVLRVTVIHIAATQDHSVRAWFSAGERPGGIPYPITGWGALTHWNPNRTPDEVAYLHDIEVPPDPAWRIAVPAPHGIRWLNLLNLANARNACSVVVNLTTI